MEDKEKQIEEMTKDLEENLRLCAGVKLLDHQVETIAYELSKKYQPKLSEDSVVLTETERITMCVEQWDKGFAQGSKETAKKIYKECIEQINDIIDTCYIKRDDYDSESQKIQVAFTLKQIKDFLIDAKEIIANTTKQFGVKL